ncbi:putative annexin D3-like [Capsicum annuum]|uniref:annexin D4 n=1 Tax=Capsicum annuum TaxID=4072 RepID=UPI001FB0FAF1|nr:annexin D4 [Capsicum annuum]XP_047258649.1 annexin D4-like [Capsicum annuum]KAF3657645.1 putative annexin D3-like [Capsicum annuum]
MSEANEFAAVTKAFSGLGVDENLFISSVARWNRYQRESYRVSNSAFFKEDERQFQRWDDHHILQLRQEFLRLKDAVVLYTMHPWERDARLFKEALLLKIPQHDVLIETACTRSSGDLLGARKAYHSLFEHSIEEDIAHHIKGQERKLLVALVSSYRYEGPKVNADLAKSEAKVFVNAIRDKKKSLIEDEDIVRILSIRSKLHLKAIYSHYKEITGNFLDEDLNDDLILKQVVQCLCVPQAYFSKILISSLRLDVEESAKDSVTRVIVTRADEDDMKLIKQEFQSKYGNTLAAKIQEVANGSYRDFLLTIIAKSD